MEPNSRKSTMSREEAAACLRAIADELASGAHGQMPAHRGQRYLVDLTSVRMALSGRR
jgi:hypothetical protein